MKRVSFQKYECDVPRLPVKHSNLLLFTSVGSRRLVVLTHHPPTALPVTEPVILAGCVHFILTLLEESIERPLAVIQAQLYRTVSGRVEFRRGRRRLDKVFE